MEIKEAVELQCNDFSLPRWDELPDIELYMDQVVTLMTKYFGGLSAPDEPPLTPSMVNNYVKNGIIPAPVKKKYSRTHLLHLIIICVMKPVLPIADISLLIKKMLSVKTQEEVLDFFAERFTNEYNNTLNVLKSYAQEDLKQNQNEEEVICTSIMHAAAISYSSKLYAEKMLGKLDREVPAEDKPKKEKKKSSKNED